LDESAYALYKQNNQYFSGVVFFYGLFALIAFALAAAHFEPEAARLGSSKQVPPPAVDRVLDVLFALTLGAYALFMYPLLLNPQIVVDVAMGSEMAMYMMRETLNRIPGVTSFMALGSLAAAIFILYPSLTGASVPKRYFALLAAVVFACVMRAWLWSDRLAVIEIGLASVIALLAKARLKRSGGAVRPLTFAPIVGIVALVIIFAIGEYFRSWQFYRNVFPGSYAEFALIRFAGYYATSLNNGAALVTLNEPLYFPTYSVEWFYQLPFWSLLDITFQARPLDARGWSLFLEAYLNPEFNNSSGLYVPLFDYGTFLGIAVWAAIGALSGYLCRAFANGDLPGMIIYPVWFTGVAEILRIFYWSDPRFFPVIVAALLIVRYLGRASVTRSEVVQTA
jgi:hypothetical protein